MCIGDRPQGAIEDPDIEPIAERDRPRPRRHLSDPKLFADLEEYRSRPFEGRPGRLRDDVNVGRRRKRRQEGDPLRQVIGHARGGEAGDLRGRLCAVSLGQDAGEETRRRPRSSRDRA